MTTILCVDDEPAVGALFEQVLGELGFGVILATDGEEALKVLDAHHVDLILADFQMPHMSGLDLLHTLENRHLKIPVVIITGHSSVEHAVLTMRSGAVDYITKPVRADTLQITVQHALDYARLRSENEVFRQEITRIQSRRKFVGRSPAVRDLLDTVATVAPTRASVLLEGESGTGKELVARAIHDQSPRRDQAFVTVNCAALPEGLVESVLFGHEKGAFTGATARAAGAFERANRGTLLLDEISEMRLDLQAKLLRAIQEQEFERVGGRDAVKVDVRIIATTNRDLHAEVSAGRFRADLYYRLHVVPIRTPPLRERPDDIPLLVQHFIKSASESLGLAVGDLPAETLTFLQQYSWPGNVRELANAVERAVILARGRPMVPEIFAAYLRHDGSARAVGAGGGPAPGATAAVITSGEAAALPLNLEELEKITIKRALESTGGNRVRAAGLLGISERTLRNKLNIPAPG
ncbi:MAG: sigma-54 dependent transcriptional regulator [Gemmatimonadales bacterium]